MQMDKWYKRGELTRKVSGLIGRISGGKSIPEDNFELRRRILLLNLIMLLGVFFLLPYSFIATIQGDIWLGIFDISTVFILAGTIFYVRRSQNYTAGSYICVVVMGALLLYATSTGGVNNTAHLWSYTFPLFVMSLLGPHKGGAMVGLYFFTLLMILFLPGEPLLSTDYGADFKIRYVTTFVAAWLVSFAAEWVRHKTQHQLERLNIVARDTDNAVIIMDARGNIEWINQSFTRMYGYTLQQLIEERGKTIIEGSANPDIERIVEDFFNEPRPVYYDSVHTNRAGEQVWARTTLSPIFDHFGNMINMVAIDSDITQLKQSEIRIKEQNEEIKKQTAKILEQAKELERSAAIAREQREAADKANLSKSEFLARMSHELRTPMNGIIGFTDILLESGLSEEQMDFARTISRSGEALMTLLNDILDLSKIEAGELSLAPYEFEPRVICEEALEIVRPRLSGKPVKMTFQASDDTPVSIKGDAGRFRQVLINLLGNAAKFTEDGEISLSLHIDECSRGMIKLHIRVKDTGIGIPEDKLTLIFDAFQQAGENTGHKFGGTGLGLSICKQLAALMDGEIWVESRPGQGSLFHFTSWMELPEDQPGERIHAAPGEDSTGHPRYFNSEGNGPCRILLAEDNPINRKLVQSILAKTGCKLTLVKNGEEAFKAYSAEPSAFDLIFMDVQMPRMNGLEATRRIRRFEKPWDLGPIPIVAMTADSMKGDREKCIEAGMDDYIPKPVKQDRIFKAIQKWTAKSAY